MNYTWIFFQIPRLNLSKTDKDMDFDRQYFVSRDAEGSCASNGASHTTGMTHCLVPRRICVAFQPKEVCT